MTEDRKLYCSEPMHMSMSIYHVYVKMTLIAEVGQRAPVCSSWPSLYQQDVMDIKYAQEVIVAKQNNKGYAEYGVNNARTISKEEFFSNHYRGYIVGEIIYASIVPSRVCSRSRARYMTSHGTLTHVSGALSVYMLRALYWESP